MSAERCPRCSAPMSDYWHTYRSCPVVEGVLYKVGAFLPISAEMIEDMGTISPMSFGFRRFTHPWEFPDRNPMPRFTPCPRLHRLTERYEAARARWQDIVYAARYGLPPTEED